LKIAAAQQGGVPITLVDEIERGLEPYRLRSLIGDLQGLDSQVFLTTHSGVALSACACSALWHIDSRGMIGRIPASIAPYCRRDSEALLARLTIIAEGVTEVGFLSFLLEKAIDEDLLARGIWISDGGGNDSTLTVLEGLSKSGLAFAGFADNEERDPNRWKTVKEKLGNLLFRWDCGCLESNIISLVPTERLEEFIRDEEGESGVRLRTLAIRLGLEDKEFTSIRANAADLTKLIVEAATGKVPDDKKDLSSDEKKAWKKHSAAWFKSTEGGRELAGKVCSFGLLPTLEPKLKPFVNEVRAAVGLLPLENLPSI
jgi:putative ATP-dependent endonuclease of the OLD family